MNILQTLFKRREPLTVLEALSEPSVYDAEDAEWRELVRRGYSVMSHQKIPNTYCFTDNGVIACQEWFTCSSFEEMLRIRRRWAKEELEIVKRLEKEWTIPPPR